MPYIERIGDQGAYEAGEDLPVTGQMLSAKDNPLAPEISLNVFLPTADLVSPVTFAELPDRFVLYTVNSFTDPDSIVCRREAEDCDASLEQLARRFDTTVEGVGVPIYGVSNDDPKELFEWGQQVGIKHDLLSSASSDEFGKEWGVYIAPWNGRLQRALFGIVNKRIVHAEYVDDQGGPIPDFTAAVNAVKSSPPLS